MPLPENTPAVLAAAGYDPILVHVSFIDGQYVITHWGEDQPQPADSLIEQWASDQVALPSGEMFSDWEAEHGGDPLRTWRRIAKDEMDGSNPQGQFSAHRALFQAVLRLLIENLKAEAWEGNQKPTPQQALTALRNKLDEIL